MNEVDNDEPVEPTAAERAARIAIAVLPQYALEPALRDYERSRPPCCELDANMRILRAG